MTRAYQEIYLSKAQAVLGDAFDYAINSCKLDGDAFIKMFIASSVSKKIENGEPIIYGTKDIDTDTIKASSTNTPYVVDKLNEYRYELEREILTFFGLNNNFEKKERLLVDEVNSNNEFITSNVDIMLKCREDFCKEVNKMFDLNISVKKKYGNIEEEVIDNEQIHD